MIQSVDRTEGPNKGRKGVEGVVVFFFREAGFGTFEIGSKVSSFPPTPPPQPRGSWSANFGG